MFAIKFSMEKQIKKFWVAGIFLPAIDTTVFSTACPNNSTIDVTLSFGLVFNNDM